MNRFGRTAVRIGAARKSLRSGPTSARRSHPHTAVQASVHCAAIVGAGARLVDVQVDLALGLPGFAIVGLPDAGCIDARTRVQTALRNSRYQLPHKKVTVNLAPGDLRKEGAAYDLAIALGVLAAARLVPFPERPALVAGELALSGELLPVRGVLPIALEALRGGIRSLVVPAPNAPEGALVQGLRVYGARTLVEAAEIWSGRALVEPAIAADPVPPSVHGVDFAEVRGQAACKRALEIAAAGGHNALLVGPPGSGKTMLARRFPTLLPPLSFEEAVETTSIWSIAGRLRPGDGLLTERPFRAPHHTISSAGLIGGGSPPRPGEISLAHRGVLFLDELPEFGRSALESLRQPLEDGEVTVVRVHSSATLPARFILLGAMNPCPCGHAADPDPARCRCTIAMQRRYRQRISGPILDRFDLHVEAPAVRTAELVAQTESESSAQVRARVESARAVQRARFAALRGVHCNAQLHGRLLRDLCRATAPARSALTALLEKFRLSARAHDRMLKLGRTIADLEGSADVHAEHVHEASQLRCLDRPLPGGAEARPIHLAREWFAPTTPGPLPGERPMEGT